MAFFAEKDCRMPADRVDPLEHVRDNFGVDLALDAEIADRLWRSEDGTHSEHERLREYEVVGGAAFSRSARAASVTAAAGLEGAGALSPVRYSTASRKPQPSRKRTRAMTSPFAPH
jgi:hypothetical protein